MAGPRLRRTFVAGLTRAGIDIMTIAELMGRDSLDTASLYTRPGAEDLRPAVDQLTADE